ncbi:hypothetical protein MSG28_013775 [Choristoneura fumiferana]|uniref:Uncharacterized protein n=1 Tax=Choristoneura fumiferana TaxID=7141 RepID=A0ACC0K8Q4_CHOFU|nr:hypothetical protein MSG28_013775 [Choristoneura fumiferana]
MTAKLVVGGPNQRNWRGILIALLVIVAVLALIVTSVVLLTPPDEGPRVKGRRLRIQDLMNDELVPVRWNGTWISGNSDYEKGFSPRSPTIDIQFDTC